MDIVVLGLVIGMANALLAAGLVLIYMSNRTINLAHGEIGAFAVAMMLSLTHSAHLGYWAALAATLAAAGALAAAIERSIIRRLYRSPRLIVLIATIGIAQLVIVLRLVLPKPTVHGQRVFAGGTNLFPLPFTFAPVTFGRVVLQPQHFLVLAAGPVVAALLFVFLRFTSWGIALRAAAENAQRARLLGIPVQRLSAMAWVAAGLLSASAAILLAPIIGTSANEAVGLPLLMRGLAGAMLARMQSVGVAFVAGLSLGVVDQVVYFATGRSGLTDLVLFGIVLVALVVRRRAQHRAGEESSWEVAEPVRPLRAEVAAHPRWRRMAIGMPVALAVAACVTGFTAPLSATFFLATVFLVAVVAVSMTILTGWAGQMSLGQWALAGLGGVLGSRFVTVLHVPFWAGFVLAIVAGAVVTLLLGLPALRLEGTALAVVTLGFAVASSSWLFGQPWFRGTGYLPRPEYLETRQYYAVALGFLIITIVVARRFQRTRVGRNMLAVRDNPLQASAFGVGVVRTKLTAFVVSGALAAGAGFLWAAGIGLADSSVFPPVRSLIIVTAVVIGGLGSIAGAVLGAFYMLGIPYFGAKITPFIGLLATGFGLLALVLFLPGGLARIVFGARDRLAKLLTGIDPRPRVERTVEAHIEEVLVEAEAQV
jgi:ABC-type branched-subunit amino acid transport system permease subunit